VGPFPPDGTFSLVLLTVHAPPPWHFFRRPSHPPASSQGPWPPPVISLSTFFAGLLSLVPYVFKRLTPYHGLVGLFFSGTSLSLKLSLVLPLLESESPVPFFFLTSCTLSPICRPDYPNDSLLSQSVSFPIYFLDHQTVVVLFSGGNTPPLYEPGSVLDRPS